MSQRIPRRQYTDDFKAQAVAPCESIDRAQAVRQLDIPVKSLASWVDATRASQPLRSAQRKLINVVKSEVARLRAENAALNMEREVVNTPPP